MNCNGIVPSDLISAVLPCLPTLYSKLSEQLERKNPMDLAHCKMETITPPLRPRYALQANILFSPRNGFKGWDEVLIFWETRKLNRLGHSKFSMLTEIRPFWIKKGYSTVLYHGTAPLPKQCSRVPWIHVRLVPKYDQIREVGAGILYRFNYWNCGTYRQKSPASIWKSEAGRNQRKGWPWTRKVLLGKELPTWANIMISSFDLAIKTPETSEPVF